MKNDILCELKDASIINFYTDTEGHCGCPTCDYGSQYINKATIETTNSTIKIEVSDMYDFPMTESFWIMFFCKHATNFSNMTEEQFIKFLKNKIYEEYKEKHYVEYDIIFDIKKN